MTYRIGLAGGGTGGHIYPLIAAIEELKRAQKTEQGIEFDFIYFGAPGEYKSILIEQGVKVVEIMPSKLRRYFDLQNVLDGFKFIIGLLQAIFRMFSEMPDVLFSKGGPGALPVVLASRFYRVPIMVHESDTVPGVTNLISARYAERIGIAFNSASEFFKGNVAVVGNPIRRSLLDGAVKTEQAKNSLGISPAPPLILVLGGSQGAQRINNFFLDHAAELVQEFQVMHQAGTKNFKEAQEQLRSVLAHTGEEAEKRYRLVPYFENDLAVALSAADVVVSRAGSGSIFEIAAFGKPSVLIPLPEASGDHQTQNAYEYAKFGAAVVVEEANLTPYILIAQIKKILSDAGRKSAMEEAARKFSIPDAASAIARELIHLARKN